MLIPLFARATAALALLLLLSFVLFALLALTDDFWIDRSLSPSATPAQEASLRAQRGWDRALFERYADWLVGNDWRLDARVGHPLVAVTHPRTGAPQWWANVDGQPTRWKVSDGRLLALVRQPDGSVLATPADADWTVDSAGAPIFWGVNERNRVVQWQRTALATTWVQEKGIWRVERDGPVRAIPLRAGALRGDFGDSSRTGLPVVETLQRRARNSVVLVGLALLVALPLVLLARRVRGGRLLASPLNRTTLLVVLLAAALGLRLLLGLQPSIPSFESDVVVWEPLLVLPVALLALVLAGPLARALAPGAAPVTIDRLTGVRVLVVLVGRFGLLLAALVIVEMLAGFPGVGRYLYRSLVFGDVDAVLAAVMLPAVGVVGTDLAGFFLRRRLVPAGQQAD